MPMLVVQGENDPFRMPPPGSTRQVAKGADLEAVASAVRGWLPSVVSHAARVV
jgi:hypothetical protein